MRRPVADRKTVGRVLGGFRLAREIASGGMASVFLAHRTQHARIGQAAAVKVIHTHLARDVDFIEMFLDEARIASCISHPNVCRVLDFGIADGTYYLAMEYVMGETLAEVMTRVNESPDARQIQASLLSQIIVQACEGLHAAHEARDPQGKLLNIVHRDISPQNIMVGYDGTVRVLDFGVASASERLHSTRAGKIKGRLAYMAPEQMCGLHTDRRADLWSLGVVLWEGLAGKRLFRREDEINTIEAVTRDPIPSLADCGRPVPQALQRVVARTLMRDREARFATARDLGLALSRITTASQARVGVPEVSVWMQALFGDRIEQKRALLREAADAAEAAAPQSNPPVPLVSSKRPTSTSTETKRRPQRQPAPPEPITSMVRAKQRRTGTRALTALLTLIILALPLPTGVTLSEHVLSYMMFRSPSAIEERTARPRPPSPLRQPSSEAKSPARTAPDPTPTKAEAPEPTAHSDAVNPQVASEGRQSVPVAETTAPKPEPPPSTSRPSARASTPVRRAQVGKKSPEPGLDPIGMVSVSAESGWADIYVGSRRIGSTPLRVWLPVGIQAVRVFPFGQGPGFVRKVNVGREGIARLVVNLPAARSGK